MSYKVLKSCFKRSLIPSRMGLWRVGGIECFQTFQNWRVCSETCVDTMQTRGTFPSHFRIPMMEGINLQVIVDKGWKRWLQSIWVTSVFSIFCYSAIPSQAFLPLLLWHRLPQSPFLSSPAWGLTLHCILLPLPLISTLSLWSPPIPSIWATNTSYF